MPRPRRPNLGRLTRNARSIRNRAQARRTAMASKMLSGSPETTTSDKRDPWYRPDDTLMKEIPTELIEIKTELKDDEYCSDTTWTPTEIMVDDNSNHSCSNIETIDSSPQKLEEFNEIDLGKVEVLESALDPSPSNEPPLPSSVESYMDALLLLKALEDYALMTENYRAIGLCTQLEKVFEAGERSKEMESAAE